MADRVLTADRWRGPWRLGRSIVAATKLAVSALEAAGAGCSDLLEAALSLADDAIDGAIDGVAFAERAAILARDGATSPPIRPQPRRSMQGHEVAGFVDDVEQALEFDGQCAAAGRAAALSVRLAAAFVAWPNTGDDLRAGWARGMFLSGVSAVAACYRSSGLADGEAAAAATNAAARVALSPTPMDVVRDVVTALETDAASDADDTEHVGRPSADAMRGAVSGYLAALGDEGGAREAFSWVGRRPTGGVFRWYDPLRKDDPLASRQLRELISRSATSASSDAAGRLCMACFAAARSAVSEEAAAGVVEAALKATRFTAYSLVSRQLWKSAGGGFRTRLKTQSYLDAVDEKSGTDVGEAWLVAAATLARAGRPVARPSDLGHLLADAARSAAARRRAAADFSLVAPPRPGLRK